MRYLILLVICAGFALAAEPVATFAAEERLGLEWAKTLVTYPLELQAGIARPDAVRLVDADGVEQPCQLWRVVTHPDGSLNSARVSFYASLAKNGGYRYRLLAEKPAAPAAPVAVTRADAHLTLDNGITAVRLPREGAAEIGPTVITAVPGPLQGVKLVTGAWTGGSIFFAANPEAAPRVTGYTCAVREQGPLFAEARVQYRFDNGGYYQCTLRLQAGDPAVRVDEQSDLTIHGDEYALRAIFSLSGGGWQPDTAYWRTNEGRLSGSAEGFDAGMQAVGFSTKPFADRNYGSRRLTYTAPFTKICDTAVWYPWHPNAYYLGLVDGRQLVAGAEKGTVPFVGVVPMHAGNWRGAVSAFNGMFFTHEKGDITLQWPLIAARHPNSLLHTGEYDPAQPLTFIRRQWALIAGPLQYHDALLAFRSYEGYVNLDDYKDWVLDWPEDPTVTYPRLVFSKADVERLKPKLAEHPGGEVLNKFLYFTDDEARYTQLWKGLTYNSCWSGPYGVAVHALRNEGWISSFRYAQMCGWAGAADELLASARLTGEQRTAFRAHLAAACEVMSEPDFNPRGAMVHLGNPNMPINRFMGLTFTAALIPDHPRAKAWLDVSADYARYKLAMNTAPGGGWSELLSYYAASAPHLIQASNVLKGANRLPDSVARLAADVGAFPMYLLSPRDPRFAARMLPEWGHEGTAITTQWLPAAGVIRDQDAALATAMAWSWDQGGRPMQEHHDAGFSERCVLHADLMSGAKADYVPPMFRSAWIPGIGAALRAHAGDPNETYLSYRQGYMISHCDNNQGDFVLYSKGAPLVALNLFAYPLHQHDPYIALDKEFGWYSHVRLGARTNRGGGWNDTSAIHAYGFGDSLDYLRGGVVYGQTRWSRQIAFLKGRSAAGPNYFLFRDSFDAVGNSALPPTWWYLRNPAKKEAVTATGTGLRYASPYGPT
ncbi:MAG TPA: hypothetical protein PK794_04800, partial [Armatimonadota bacterium]|nr:hypothetical protein [Armatimonadota bacterium]